MDAGVLITSLVLIGIILIPIILVNRNKNHKKERARFKQIASSEGFKIEDVQVINTLLIAVHEETKKLFISSTENIQKQFETIDLNDFSQCTIIRSKPSQTSFQFVGIQLSNTDSSKKIMFYEDQLESDLLPKRDFILCVEDAQKWEEKLKGLIQNSN